MSTDLYGIRVLDVAPDELRARFRVFVVYYDTHDRSHAPVPNDPSFFLQVLWEAARNRPATSLHPLRMVGTGDICDTEWVAAQSHRYVRRMQQVDVRNHPVPADGWSRLNDFYYERDGSWADEDHLVQADYDVEVTDPRWLEALRPGDSWATTSYPIVSDQILTDDAPTVLDLREPAVTLDLFPDEETDAGTPSDLAFSDDGRYLAVTSQACELVVVRTDDWSEQVRIADSPLWGQDIRWVPGTHRIAGRLVERGDEENDTATRAYDIDTGTEVEVPPQPREVHSRTGRYRAIDGLGGRVEMLSESGAPRISHLPGPGPVSVLAFTNDENRLFLRQRKDIYTVDTATGRIHHKLAGINTVTAIQPSGDHLVSGEVGTHGYENNRLDLWRVSDGALLMRCRTGGRYFGGMTWSPDGSMFAVAVITGYQAYGGAIHIYRAGSPVERPAEVHLSARELRAEIKKTYVPSEIISLYNALIEREEDSAAIGGAYYDKADFLCSIGDHRGAADAFRRAVEVGGTSYVLRASYGLASVLCKLGEFDDAVAAARTAYRMAGGRDLGRTNNQRKLARTAYRLADVLCARGHDEDNEEAANAYQQALDFGVDAPARAIVGLARIALRQENVVDAERLLLRAVETATDEPGLVPEVAEATFRLGAIAAEKGERERALEYLERAVATRHAKFAEPAAELLAGLMADTKA